MEGALARLEIARPSYEELHKLRHKLREQNREISNLQKALSDATVALHTEKEKSHTYRMDIDTIRSTQAQDRKRMQELLALLALDNSTSRRIISSGGIKTPAVSFVEENSRCNRPENLFSEKDSKNSLTSLGMDMLNTIDSNHPENKSQLSINSLIESIQVRRKV